MVSPSPPPPPLLPAHRKGATRISIYFTLLMMYAIVMLEVGRSLYFSFTTSIPRTDHIMFTTSSYFRINRRLFSEYSNQQPHDNITDRRNIEHRKRKIHNVSGNNNETDFMKQFKDTLFAATTISNATSITNDVAATNFAALILKDNKVYCSPLQIQKLSRARYFVQMLREGLKQRETDDCDFASCILPTLPILIKHDDSNGCYPHRNYDKYGYPRLTWSIPSDTTAATAATSDYGSSSWCSAIGMPSYKLWKDLTTKKKDDSIDANQHNNKYRWQDKINKAIWRGSTTVNKAMYGHLPLKDIPRSKLVQLSFDTDTDTVTNHGNSHSSIDAGYHKIVGKYTNDDILIEYANSKSDDIHTVSNNNDQRRKDTTVGTMLKPSIPLHQMSKYKAIIDIDGNNWSARFHTILCTSNSIIIKIAPDFIEEYYKELTPNVHYIPASLDNITRVVEYVLDEANEEQMKRIIKNANDWCIGSSNKKSLVDRAMNILLQYKKALDTYHNRNCNWKDYSYQKMNTRGEYSTWSYDDLDYLKSDLVECIV